MPSGIDLSWTKLVRTVISDTLIANMTLAERAFIQQTINAVTVDKIFWEGVDDDYSQPQIIMAHMSGGDKNSSHTEFCEVWWRIVGHATNITDADYIEGAIHKALHKQEPVVNFDDVTGTGVIEETMPVTDRYQVQNGTNYISGAIYRIRLCK